MQQEVLLAAICKEGVMRIDQPIEEIERSIVSYGSVQTAYFERGCSWIRLFIAMAPSLGSRNSYRNGACF